MTGISSNTNTAITWTVPPTNTVNPTNTMQVSVNPSVPSSSNVITSIGNYSVGVIDNNNLCRSTYTIQVIQDIRKPVFTASALSNSVITCFNSSVTIVPVMAATIAVALVPTYTWFAPPSGPGIPGTSYITITPGTHTAINMATTNGCTYQATYNVGVDNSIGAFGGQVNASCPITMAVVSPTFTTGPSGLTFTWTGPPGSILSPINQSTIMVNALGTYTCAITNIANSCTYTIQCVVVCSNGLFTNFINANLLVFPNPSNGIITIDLPMIEPRTKMIIYDLQGKMLSERLLNSKVNKIDLQLPKGCYFYRVTIGNEVVKRDKLIIE
ncbi:MAG: T9SS type A sorting domain-containing protein [Bacteroidota bacterium]|nr:T9SS type A sorting domain-containing protein [Bacteroidota bacterium]